MILGIAPSSYGKPFFEGFERAPINNPFVAYFRAAILLSRGDAQRAGRILDSAVRDTLKFPEFLRGAYVGALGWRALLVGDTATGIRLLRMGRNASAATLSFPRHSDCNSARRSRRAPTRVSRGSSCFATGS